MDIEVLKKEVNEYFEYMKTIYLNEFQRYLTNETIEFIRSSNDIFQFNNDLVFKIINEKNITFHLDLKKFIEENNLKDEGSLLDISEEGKAYISYLLENENNVYGIIKNKILKEIIRYFCKCGQDVISLGTVDIIVDYLACKYKLPQEKYISSKEKEVALYLKEIVGEKLLFAGVINHQHKIISDTYNLYTENNGLENYETLISELNKIYHNYFQKIGKVYFSDSLYEYENLNYGIVARSKQVQEEKQKSSMMQLKRLSSLKCSLDDIDRHHFLFTTTERMLIKNSIIEVGKILEAIMIDGREHVSDYIGEQFGRLLKVEDASLDFVQKIWGNALTNIEDYNQGEFRFLVTSSITGDVIEATYITSEHLKNIKTSRNDFGFIIEPVNKGLIYASCKDFLYRNCSDIEDYKPTYDTIYINNIPLEIDNQEVSKLITPDMIEEENIKGKTIKNKVLLDKTHLRIVGIYTFTDDLEDSPSYNKAQILAEEYNLPIAKISPKQYFQGVEESVKMDVRIKLTEKTTEGKSLFDKIRDASSRLFYDEGISEVKKTI